MYAGQIREEYAHYSKEDYKTGRAGVLERLRERNDGGVYFTEYWRSQRRDAALANMEWEQTQLDRD